MANNIGMIIGEMQRLQQEFKQKTVEVVEGAGVFRVVMNGHQEVLEVQIDPSFLNAANLNAFEEIICSAVNRAIVESKVMVKNEIAKITGGMGMPNIQGLF